jgi:hypothetical protein
MIVDPRRHRDLQAHLMGLPAISVPVGAKRSPDERAGALRPHLFRDASAGGADNVTDLQHRT